MASFSYLCEFAGVPFCLDEAFALRLKPPPSEFDPMPGRAEQKQQSPPHLMDLLDRLLPNYADRATISADGNLGRNAAALARPWPYAVMPPKVGEFFYPTGASRWGCFRGLATAEQVKAMYTATAGGTPATFTMRGCPVGQLSATFTVQTNMRMLAATQLGEHGNRYPGLYLVTLVDDRYYWQDSDITLAPISATDTWATLIARAATALTITLTYSTIQAAYGRPEPDSQLWTTAESAATVLDALAANIGRVLIRTLNGTYTLQTPAEAAAIATTNRNAVLNAVGRLAGGDPFDSASPFGGDLGEGRNPSVPSVVRVNYPLYVTGNDPVPHFLNPRYDSERPTAWYSESFGSVFAVDIPVASGGASVSGVAGVGTVSVRDTAKALVSGEAQAQILPYNASGLTALAGQVAQDFYAARTLAPFDERYPGTYVWTPEGLHDIVWTYAAKAGGSSTRALPPPWNQSVREFQHGTPNLSGMGSSPPGVGGPVVPQTWRDSLTSGWTGQLAGRMASGLMLANLGDAAYLPTQNRWKGKIDDEIILFEGSSGGLFSVAVARRGIEGTAQVEHQSGAIVELLAPQTTYGANLVTVGPGQFVQPDVWVSGGVTGGTLIPQTQTVCCLAADGVLTSSGYYSGQVGSYDPRVSGRFVPRENVWVFERNGSILTSGRLYDGQFGWYSPSFGPGLPIAPVYLVNDPLAFTGNGTVPPTVSGFPICPSILFNEQDTTCDNGYISVFTRPVIVTIVSGCLTQNYGAWVFSHTAGCCGCASGVTPPSSGGSIVSGTQSGGGGGGGGGLPPPPPPPPPTGSCSECPGGAAAVWVVTLAGLADNGNCDGCASSLNGTHLLTYVSGCEWIEIIGWCFDAGAGVLQLIYNGAASRWEFRINSTGGPPGTPYDAMWTIPAASFNCLGANVLTFDSGNTSCDNWPATVTVTPL